MHQRHRLQADRRALPRLDSTNLGILQMVAGGYADEARDACALTLLPAGGWGQTDVPAPAFTAWNRHARVVGFASGALACLAAIAAQLFAQTARAAPPALAGLFADTLAICPPLQARRSLGPELGRLTEVLFHGLPG